MRAYGLPLPGLVRPTFEFLQDRMPELGDKVTDQRDISRWIEKRGEGIHHIAVRVDDIDAAIQEVKAKGLRVLDEKGRPGARGSKVAFIHPKSTGGVLIHFVERAETTKGRPRA